MPRMFDILREARQADDNRPKDRKESPKSEGLHFSFLRELLRPKETPRPSEKKEEKKRENHFLISKKLISAVKMHGVDNHEKAKVIYENAVETVNVLLEKIENKEDLNPFMDNLYELIDEIYQQLVLGDALLSNIYAEREEDYYLPYHMVNILVLSIFLGIKMGFNKSRMRDLGLGCIFCDAGLDPLWGVIKQPRELTEEETIEVGGHISRSLAVVGKIAAINKTVKDAIGMHHEKADGSGYPGRLKLKKISPNAKIIGLVDTYTAITNDRPHRKGINAHQTIKLLLGSLKAGFDYEAIRLLINSLSIYPIGSIVELDIGGTARVISAKPGSPLRPAIMIIQDMDGNPVKDRKIIDLSRSDSPSIKSSS